MLSRLLSLCSHQLMFQMLKPGELGSHLLQTLDGFIFVLSRWSKITIVIIHTSLIITRKIMEKLLMGHYSTNLTICRSSMFKLLTYYYILAMGRSCTSARQLVSTLVWVRWSTTLYFKWNQKGRNFIQWIPSGRHESFSPNLELQQKNFNLPKVELTGNSIYEYIHPLDHEEIGHLLTVQPLHYSQGNTLSHYFHYFQTTFFVNIYHVQRVLEDVHHLTWYKLFRYWTRALLCSSNEMCSGKKKRGTHKWRI